jgi:hypothetical protein
LSTIANKVSSAPSRSIMEAALRRSCQTTVLLSFSWSAAIKTIMSWFPVNELCWGLKTIDNVVHVCSSGYHQEQVSHNFIQSISIWEKAKRTSSRDITDNLARFRFSYDDVLQQEPELKILSFPFSPKFSFPISLDLLLVLIRNFRLFHTWNGIFTILFYFKLKWFLENALIKNKKTIMKHQDNEIYQLHSSNSTRS